MVKIVKDIYQDPVVGKILGFKGGTAALLFYDLPRYSVDLDFDLLDYSMKDEIRERLRKILASYGELLDDSDKKYTLFFFLRYKKDSRNMKIEISKRPPVCLYNIRNYLGIPVKVIVKDDMAANKLAALITRAKFAMRDMFDVWFFLSSDYKMNKTLIKEQTGLSYKNALKKAISLVKPVKENEILSGLGELIDNKQKAWVKTKLKDELIFLLRLQLKTAE